ATPTQAPTNPTTPTNATPSSTPVTGHSQTAPQGNETNQVLVPIASPAIQTNVGNDSQVLTYKSENGDYEANNQSQETGSSGESSKRSESKGCGCERSSRDGSDHKSGG